MSVPGTLAHGAQRTGAAPVLALRAPTPGQTACIGAAATCNIALALVQQWYIVTALGAGRETDALFSAFAVPNALLGYAMGPITQVLVPLLAVEGPEQFLCTAWTFFLGLGGLFGAVAALLGAAAPWWLPWTLPGFDGAALELTVQLLRIQIVAVLFTPLSLVLWSVHQARSRFLGVELSTGLATLASLGLIVWGLPRFGAAAAAAGFALKPALQALFLVPGLGAPRRPRWGAPGVSEAWRRLRPLFLGVIYCRTDQILDRFLASLGPAGSIALLSMAQQMYLAANTIIGKALVGPLSPALASAALGTDRAGMRALVRRRSALVVGVGLGGLLALAAAGRPLLGALLGSQRFTPEQLDALWRILLALGGAFVAVAPIGIASAAFCAVGDTRTLTRISSAVYTGAVLLRGGLFHTWGLLGLAAAISVQMLTTAGALLHAFHPGLRDEGRPRA